MEFSNRINQRINSPQFEVSTKPEVSQMFKYDEGIIYVRFGEGHVRPISIFHQNFKGVKKAFIEGVIELWEKKKELPFMDGAASYTTRSVENFLRDQNHIAAVDQKDLPVSFIERLVVSFTVFLLNLEFEKFHGDFERVLLKVDLEKLSYIEKVKTVNSITYDYLNFLSQKGVDLSFFELRGDKYIFSGSGEKMLIGEECLKSFLNSRVELIQISCEIAS